MEPTTTPLTTDPRPQFAAATETLRSVVAGVDPAQFDEPTACTEMDVRQLIDHLGMAVGRVTAAGHRRPLEEWPTEGDAVFDDAVAFIDGHIAEAVMRRELPLAERALMWEEYAEAMPEGIPFVKPFDDAVPVPDDATPIERLVAWNGRRP